MSERIAIGNVAPVPKGEWSGSTAYGVLNIVTNNGSSYIAKQSVPAGTALTNTDYWQVVAQKGDTGDTGATGNGVASTSVEKTGTSGNVDTYTMTVTYTDGTSDTSTFVVTNGVDGEIVATVIASAYNASTAYKVGNLLTYLGKQYYCIADAPAGTLPTNTTYFEEKSVADIIEMIKQGAIQVGKANLANNFDSKMVLTDNSGYLYRTTGGSLEVGEQNRVKKIIGASVPIIQLARSISSTHWNNYSNSHTSVTFSDGVASLTALSIGSYSYEYGVGLRDGYAYSLIAGHKYLVCVDIKSSVNRNFAGEIYTNGTDVQFGTVLANVWTTKRQIFSATSNITKKLLLYPASVVEGDTWQFRNAGLIDLTQTFGTTVANRIYALEQAQAGTGIAKAREILVKDYYPYNVTAFTHTKTSGKVNNGFNQWDEQWEQGAYNSSGEKVSASGAIRSKNYIPVFPNTTYYYKNGKGNNGRICFYDADKVFISTDTGANVTYTTPTNCEFITFNTGTDYGTTYANNLCINLHWDGERDGEYEPYQEWNYPVEDIELKGILSLDAQDNWVADGDEYLPSGVVDENYDIIDLSSLDWTYVTDYTYPLFKTSIANLNFAVPVGTMKVACSKYVSIGAQYYGIFRSNSYDKCCCVINNQNVSTNFAIQDSAYTDATAFKNSLSGVYLVYQKATPTQTTADSYTELQNDSNWGTEKWIDTRDVPLPVFSTCEYIPDLKAKVETAPESPDEDGDYIMHRENGLNSYGSLSTWLSANGYNKMQDLLSSLCVFLNNTRINWSSATSGEFDAEDTAKIVTLWQESFTQATLTSSKIFNTAIFVKTGTDGLASGRIVSCFQNYSKPYFYMQICYANVLKTLCCTQATSTSNVTWTVV